MNTTVATAAAVQEAIIPLKKDSFIYSSLGQKKVLVLLRGNIFP
jgi:hypothetical protein